MILAGSLEFEKGHNNEIQERPSDNIELPEVSGLVQVSVNIIKVEYCAQGCNSIVWNSLPLMSRDACNGENRENHQTAGDSNWMPLGEWQF